MRSWRTFRWGISGLVICAGLAALQSGIAQETANRGDETRDVAGAIAELTFEAEPRESKRREPDREKRGDRGRRGGGEYGAYGRGGGEMGRYGGERGQGGYGGMGAYGGRGSYGMSPGDMMHRIREAAAALSEAKDDDAREEAERRLNNLLNEYFEEDMKRREEELANVERRVKELRDLLERRREKKEDIIELQVEVLRNEVDGLGFFSEPQPGGKGVLQLRLNNPYGGAVAVPGAPAPYGLPGGHPPVQQAVPPQPPQTAPPAR